MGRYWLVLDDTGSVEGGSGWYLVVLGHYRVVLVETLWYWVSIGRNWVSRWRNWLEIGGTESVWSRGWYWCWPHGQKKAVLVVSRLYSVSTGRYWFVLGDTGSV